MSVNFELKKSFVKLDNIFGFRGWGLILYGALPSNLALLGVSEVKIEKINEFSPFFFILASILPIFLIFMLIRERHREWYLTKDLLTIRSGLVTFFILLLSSLISGISGIIHNRYIIGLPQSLNWNEWTAITESFLMAAVSLVISSALFMTTLTNESNLPGLPTIEFVNFMKELQKDMRHMMRNEIWEKYVNLNDEKFISSVYKIKQNLNQARNYTGNQLAKESLEPIEEDINNLFNVLNEIKGKGSEDSSKIIWGIYFAELNVISHNQRNQRLKNEKKFNSIERLKRLNLGD